MPAVDVVTTAVVDEAGRVLHAVSDAAASRAGSKEADARLLATTMTRAVAHLAEAEHGTPSQRRAGLRQARSALAQARRLSAELNDLQGDRTNLATSVARLVSLLEEVDRAADSISPPELDEDALRKLRSIERGTPAPAVITLPETDTAPVRRRPWWENTPR